MHAVKATAIFMSLTLVSRLLAPGNIDGDREFIDGVVTVYRLARSVTIIQRHHAENGSNVVPTHGTTGRESCKRVSLSYVDIRCYALLGGNVKTTKSGPHKRTIRSRGDAEGMVNVAAKLDSPYGTRLASTKPASPQITSNTNSRSIGRAV